MVYILESDGTEKEEAPNGDENNRTDQTTVRIPNVPSSPSMTAQVPLQAALHESDDNKRRESILLTSESKRSSSSKNASMTYGAQSQLPRLPIPTLEDTLVKFPKVLEALQDDKEQAETQRQVEKFLRNEGPILQKALVEYEQAGVDSGVIGSYVEEFWNESYLAPDASVVLNLNPYFVLEKGPDAKIANDQLRRAASLCFASVKLASTLKHESLAPDIFKGKPLCMDQFKVLFGSSRQPRAKTSKDASVDDIHVYSDSSHVAVLCHNQFYYFPVLWPDTGHVAVDEADILDVLRAIQQHAEKLDATEASQSAIGVLTALPRSEWASARQELSTHSVINQTSLHVIDSALFILVLDDFVAENIHDVAANMLHGSNKLAPTTATPSQDGGAKNRTSVEGHHVDSNLGDAIDTQSQTAGETDHPVGRDGFALQIGTCLNRWYDKLQLIVCKDGTAGVNFEHAAIDGHTALRFVSDVFAETVITFAESITQLIHGAGHVAHVINAVVERAADVNRNSKNPASNPQNNRPSLDVFPKKLVFELSEAALTKIFYAETALADHIIANDTVVLEFHEYGKVLIVGNKMSPDAFVQMSMILAYYRLYGRIVCTYEPVLTKSFYHGRTEAMRSATPQAKRLCEVWCNRLSTREEKLEALRTACQEHSRLCAESAEGRGVDRHLFALKCMAEKLEMPTPEFFKSNAWNTLNHTILSTSNCGNPALRLFGFGPVVQNGFGIGYIIKDQGLSFAVSSKHRQTQRYVMMLERTLQEMKQLLKALSDVQVSQHRPVMKMKQIKVAAPILSNYDDFFGESVAGPPSSSNGGSSTYMNVKEKKASLHVIEALATEHD